jgi:hypothetical protein
MRLIRTTKRPKDRDQSDPGHVWWLDTKEGITCSSNTVKKHYPERFKRKRPWSNLNYNGTQFGNIKENYNTLLLSMGQQPLVGQGLLYIKPSRPHSDTPHSVGLLWTSDRPDEETSTGQHATITKTDIRDSNPQCQQASDRKRTT